MCVYMQGALWETNYGANLRWRGIRERGASRGRFSKTKVNLKDVLRSGTVAFASGRRLEVEILKCVYIYTCNTYVKSHIYIRIP